MLKSISRISALIVQRCIPDAFVFAVILTFVTLFAGVFFEGKTFFEMIQYWGDGFFNLLKFSAQMALVLICGFALAKTKLVDIFLNKLMHFIDTQFKAVLFVSIVSILGCYINWGFGLVVSGLISIKIYHKLERVNFGLVVASAYSGFLVWHGGLSGSIPLKMASNSKILTKLGVANIKLSESLYSGFNLSILFLTVFIILCVNLFRSLYASETMTNKKNIESVEHDISEESLELSFASKLENSKISVFVVVLIGGIYIFNSIYKIGFSLNLVIMIFLFLGILFSMSLKKYIQHFSNSVSASSGILLQFPFYAGIMGMMAQSGLAQSLSEFFISISTADTFLFNTYLSAGIVNFFVPSGGGQWVVQGPIVLDAAQKLGIDLSQAAMTLAWGDAWTNMIQPFWALPLLSIAKIELKEIMGHCILLFFTLGICTSIFLLL